MMLSKVIFTLALVTQASIETCYGQNNNDDNNNNNNQDRVYRYAVVSRDEEHFLLQADQIQGTKFLQNGSVHSKKDVKVSADGELTSGIPEPIEGSFFNQDCTALDGSGISAITQSMCSYNLCLANKGCIMMQSGGSFEFDPLTEMDVPDVTGFVVGGTKRFKKWTGKQMKIVTRVRRGINDQGRPEGPSVLEIEIRK